ncbi:YjjG family noncanonical pyrimidine nucleotidase [Chungangia koreensis]|uniref:YjjG family noncanonical pyrimidine nucleotidase n=1 Tax=Chungangia koreensis TaxID=752657 RepID=A0ABV8X5F0_9LACT
MKSYKTLFFDVDDTLLDFGATERKALRSLFNEIQFDLSPEAEDRYRTINRALWSSYEEGEIGRDEVLNTRFSLFLKEFGREENGAALETKYRAYIANGHDLIPGAFEIITELYHHYDLYIVTNGVSDTQYKRLKDSNLLPFFKEVFVSEDTGYQKPMKEFFSYVFDRIPRFVPADGLIIGDSLTADIKGGYLSNLDTCWYNPRHIINELGINPTYEIHSISELRGILLR